MNVGLFKHRLQLQEGSETKDEYGGVTYTWTTKRECWGQIIPLDGKEFIEAMKLNSKLTHRVYIRKYNDVKPSWRIKYGSRYFDIKYVFDMKEKGKYTTMLCEEIVDG